MSAQGPGRGAPFNKTTNATRGHSGLAVSTPLTVRDAGVSPPLNPCVPFLDSDSKIVGLGVDLVAVSRVEKMTRRDEDIFRLRILGERERAEIPFDAETRSRNSRYAAAIAGKEALLKALGSGLSQGDRWSDIQVVGQRTATPSLAVSGAPRERMTSLHADGIQFSVSMRMNHALACVLLTSGNTNESGAQ